MILQYSKPAYILYPSGTNLNYTLNYTKEVSKIILETFKFGSFYLIARGSSGAILSALVAKDLCDNGRNVSIIIRQSLSIELSDIDEVYYDLQAKHRGYQARLNRILHEFESFAEEKYAEDLKNYEKYQTESNEAYKQAEIAKEHFIDMANRELNSCKITIPNSLQSIYSKINSLGK